MWHAFLRGLLELCLYLAQVCVLCNLGGGGGGEPRSDDWRQYVVFWMWITWAFAVFIFIYLNWLWKWCLYHNFWQHIVFTDPIGRCVDCQDTDPCHFHLNAADDTFFSFFNLWSCFYSSMWNQIFFFFLKKMCFCVRVCLCVCVCVCPVVHGTDYMFKLCQRWSNSKCM